VRWGYSNVASLIVGTLTHDPGLLFTGSSTVYHLGVFKNVTSMNETVFTWVDGTPLDPTCHNPEMNCFQIYQDCLGFVVNKPPGERWMEYSCANPPNGLHYACQSTEPCKLFLTDGLFPERKGDENTGGSFALWSG
jgi:hypothetical protein